MCTLGHKNRAAESEANRNSQNDMIFNLLKNLESPIILDSLELSVELNKDGKTSWFTSMVNIDESLDTQLTS